MQSRIENLIRDYKIKIKSFDSRIERKRRDVILERHNALLAHVEPMNYADFVYEKKDLQRLQDSRQQLLQTVTDLESILELEGVYE